MLAANPDPELQRWLLKYRQLISGRLKLDRHKSPRDLELYDAYRKVMGNKFDEVEKQIE